MTQVEQPQASSSSSSSSSSFSTTSTSSTSSTTTTTAREWKQRVSDRALDEAFNDLWANNANAISHCYSNTDALKVDFTRTGKRSFLGMINDATNSVYRMVQGAVTDFFRQTVLDFAYGSIGLGGLERYYDDLDSRDPSETVRLARVRASAIQSCKRDVVPEGEQVLGGWTLFSPVEQNKVHSMKLEEKVALLTSKAIYVCRYDFGAESLLEFTRVLIGDITGLQEGLYIISPNEGYHPEDNWGFVISYLNEERRLNTSSMKNIPPPTSPGEKKILAFRAITDEMDASGSAIHSNVTSSTAAGTAKRWSMRGARTGTSSDPDDLDDDGNEGAGSTSHQIVDRIVSMMLEQCIEVGACDGKEEEEFLKHETIQGLAEAKANVPLFGPLIEGLKRRLWL